MASDILSKDTALLIVAVGILALMVVRLNPYVLDSLLAVNITFSIIIFLTSIYVLKPLEFSSFPSVLLFATLFRLSLNVASTRLILLGAAENQVLSGRVIEAFGNFVVGGNLVVGIVVFLILVLINFIVITKGAGRIAEVAARFTLDALPGKQMSIDAELASGAVTDIEARERRESLQLETDFYGAMDGASKFVRGDAIAGLLITGINLVGGLIIGTFQGGLSFADAANTYAILTIGDGLVGQIPALFISTGAGIIVTRAASANNFSEEMGDQLLADPRVLFGSATVVFLLGLFPGMPGMVFFGIAGAIGFLGYRVLNQEDKEEAGEAVEEDKAEPDESEVLEGLLRTELLAVQIGYGLIPLVTKEDGGRLVDKLGSLRRQVASTVGLILPPIHISDDLSLEPETYRLQIRGVPVTSGQVRPGKLLAIDSGWVMNPIEGEETVEPTFGLKAVWIEPEEKYRAEASGYTVVDCETVITTHVSETVQRCAARLIGWQEVQELLDVLKDNEPKLVEETVPALVTMSILLQVLRGLLSERVAIRDLRSVLEVLAENTSREMSVSARIDLVRVALRHQISDELMDADRLIRVLLLGRDLEDRFRQSLITQSGEPVLACDLVTAQGIFSQLEEYLPKFMALDAEAAILAPPDLRGPLNHFLLQFFPNLRVISHKEIVQQAQIESIGDLTLSDQPKLAS